MAYFFAGTISPVGTNHKPVSPFTVVVAGRVSVGGVADVAGCADCPAAEGCCAKTGAATADRRIAKGTVRSNLLCIATYLYGRQCTALTTGRQRGPKTYDVP